MQLPTDLEALREEIRDKNVAMVLLDPLMSAISGTLDTHKDAHVRLAPEPMSRLAHVEKITVVGLIHENKSNAGDLLTRVMGSRAFSAVVRAVLWCAKYEPSEEEDPTFRSAKGLSRFAFGQPKNNLAAKARDTLPYHIESAMVGHDDELHLDSWSSKIVYDGAEDQAIQDMVTNQETRTTKKETAQDRAEAWLTQYLKIRGPVLSKQIKEDAEDAGHNPRTVERASQQLGVVVKTVQGSKHSTTWELPDPGTATTPLPIYPS
jgi:hypothetical protein